MSCVNEFGIMDSFDPNKQYIKYEAKNYNCIEVDDDIICEIISQLENMICFWFDFSNIRYGLNHWGITIIPPESLDIVLEALSNSRYYQTDMEVTELFKLITLAKIGNKHIIHFGV